MKELMDTIESHEETLEKQENLLILENERDLELKEILAKEKKKVEKLSKDLDLANVLIASLESSNCILQEELSCLDKIHKTLEVQIDTLKNSIPTYNDATLLSNASTGNSCSQCYNIDINACATNVESLQALQKENERLNALVKYG